MQLRLVPLRLFKKEPGPPTGPALERAAPRGPERSSSRRLFLFGSLASQEKLKQAPQTPSGSDGRIKETSDWSCSSKSRCERGNQFNRLKEDGEEEKKETCQIDGQIAAPDREHVVHATLRRSRPINGGGGTDRYYVWRSFIQSEPRMKRIEAPFGSDWKFLLNLHVLLSATLRFSSLQLHLLEHKTLFFFFFFFLLAALR
ncbi:hypothetical protein F2P81_002742 [Scophthalmus maximus]|uniref:Uncharacterized protein n=1 Tax=Scophthalmus maximus TaxID=52904 RepID=A0A6A4TJK5_SCOMX|nr:hypothetical protein F2P81_002742 [Scophthalmus maximus]